MSKPLPTILYLCDGKACGETCPNEDCHHTHQWEHALHKEVDVEKFAVMPGCGDSDAMLLVEPLDEC